MPRLIRRLIRPKQSSAGARIASLVALCIVLCIVGIAMLTINLRDGLVLQASASSDNTQWTFSQLDVEYTYLTAAVRVAQTDAEELPDLRKRFDILFNRATILREGKLFAPLLKDPLYATGMAAVTEFLNTYVPMIDGTDSRLTAALPQMMQDVTALRSGVKSVISSGISAFALYSDRQRLNISRNLIQLGMLTAFMVSLLIILTVVLLRLNKSNNDRAQQIQTSLARTESIVTAAIDAVLVIDAEGKALEFNPAAVRMFGYRRDEIMGQPIGVLFRADQNGAALDGWTGFLQGGIAKQRTRSFAARRNGAVFPIELSVVEGRDSNGPICVLYLRDLSLEIANAEALHQARDEAKAGEKTKADLLAVMSHEMRTPLNGMLGMIELLEATPLNTDQRRFLQAMQNSGDILLHHVEDVLKIAKLESGTVTLTSDWVDMAELVHQIFANQSALAAAKGNQLVFQPSLDAPNLIYSASFQLRQVLLNLIGNAVKFTRHGVITVTTQLDLAAGVYELRVIDTGIGIAVENRERVFDDFVTLDTSYSRNSGGTGLGLGITRRIVETLGGTINVEPNPGGGSMFRVRLPHVLPQYDSKPAFALPLRDTALPKDPMRILVAEDNEINRMLVRELIAKLGHQVNEAHDGHAAVQMALASLYDVILMDISMPVMDGISAAQAIRHSAGPNRATPIVALTAHALTKDRDRIAAAGMQEVLVKPIHGKALAALLAKINRATVTPLMSPRLIDEMRVLLGPARLDQTLASFASEAESTLKMVDPEPTAQTAKALHRLAGAAGMLGAERFAEALRGLQDACAVNDAAAFHRLWPELLSIWQATQAAIQVINTETSGP